MTRSVLAAVCAAAALIPLAAQGQKDLASLLQAGDRKEALKQIRAGADVNKKQADGTSALHWAILRVDYEVIEELIKRGAKPSTANAFGSTPIAEAAKLDDARMVKMLLDAGAEPEGANADGQSALMLAVKTGNLDSVRLLLSAGANVNNIEAFHKQTPLMWAAAAEKNAAAMADLLLAKGADTKARSKFTDWPSQVSSEPRGQYRPVGGLTALLYAARNGCYECVESLVKAKADVNVPTPEGVTPLMIAIDNGHNEVANLLLASGAKSGLWDWWGRTALYIAIDRKTVGPGRGGRGGTAPQAARAGNRAAVSSMDLIARLLDVDVDVNATMNFHRPSRGGNSGRFGERELSTGTTPLFRAVQKNDMEVVRALLAKGADPNIVTMGYTPFLVAAGVGGGGTAGPMNRELLDLLVQRGADVNAQVTDTLYSYYTRYQAPPRREGTSALHDAAQKGSLELVKYLLDHGANPNLRDKDGRRPVDLIGTGATAAAGAGAAKGKGKAAPAPNAANAAEIRSLLEAAANR
jgi:serine/threonine-protein phosphatase 6 regulatory ankyrin repeat subunit B